MAWRGLVWGVYSSEGCFLFSPHCFPLDGFSALPRARLPIQSRWRCLVKNSLWKMQFKEFYHRLWCKKEIQYFAFTVLLLKDSFTLPNIQCRLEGSCQFMFLNRTGIHKKKTCLRLHCMYTMLHYFLRPIYVQHW